MPSYESRSFLPRVPVGAPGRPGTAMICVCPAGYRAVSGHGPRQPTGDLPFRGKPRCRGALSQRQPVDQSSIGRRITLQSAGIRSTVSSIRRHSSRGGVPGGRHIVPGGQCARGGAALLPVVMTQAGAKQRITPGCAGPNGDAARAALARITTFACTIGCAECSGFRDEPGPGARSLGLSRPAFAASRRFAASPV